MEWGEVLLYSLPLWTLLYFVNSTFKFYVKIFVYYSILCFTPLVVLPLAIFRPFDAFNVIYPSYIGKFVSWCYGINWKIRGLENRDKVRGQSVIIVSNHQAIVDALGLCCVYPIIHPATMVMKKELAYMGLFGLYSILSSCVFLDRNRTEKAKNALNRKMEEVVRRHWSLVVYPEGTRNPELGRPLPDGSVQEMLPFKKGAFHISVTYQIPILPIVYEPYLQVYDAKKKIFSTGDLQVHILPPVYPTGLTTGDVAQLAERVRCDMMRAVRSTPSVAAGLREGRAGGGPGQGLKANSTPRVPRPLRNPPSGRQLLDSATPTDSDLNQNHLSRDL